MSEVAAASRPVQRPGLPAGGHPAGGVGPALAVLLRRRPDRRVQHDPRLVRARAAAVAPGRRRRAMPSIVIEATWAAAGGDGDHLPRRAAERARPSCTTRPRSTAPPSGRRSGTSRCRSCAAILFVTLILQLIAHGAAVHRAVPVHGRRPGELDDDGAAADLPLRVPEQPRRRLRDGRRAERHAGRLPGACSPAVYFWLTRSWSTSVMRPRLRRARDAEERARPSGASISAADWRRRRFRWSLRAIHRRRRWSFLLIVGLGPLLWMAKSAITPTQDTLRTPMALWPHGFDLGQPRHGLVADPHRPLPVEHGAHRVRVVGRPDRGGDDRGATRCRCCGRGSAGCSLGLVLATLFVPPIVLLVPLYLTVVDMPVVHVSADRHVLGGVAAGRRERVQRRPDEALLRQPAARDLRGRAGRRRRARSGCSGRSCCRCRGRSWAWCRCSR